MSTIGRFERESESRRVSPEQLKVITQLAQAAEKVVRECGGIVGQRTVTVLAGVDQEDQAVIFKITQILSGQSARRNMGDIITAKPEIVGTITGERLDISTLVYEKGQIRRLPEITILNARKITEENCRHLRVFRVEDLMALTIMENAEAIDWSVEDFDKMYAQVNY